jgi:hypothetical protein
MFTKRIVLAVLVMGALSSAVQAESNLKSKGIGFRWGFWNQGNRGTLVTYIRQDGREFVETGGLGGWIYFISRAGDDWLLEFSLGAFAQVREQTLDNFNDDLDVNVTIPILLGLRRDLLAVDNSSALRPYISFGGGPYWLTHVKEQNDFRTEEVVSTMKGGVYFGGGMNFFISKSFAIDFDVKYHAVDLDFDHEISGLEIGVGFSIMWGDYKSKHR